MPKHTIRHLQQARDRVSRLARERDNARADRDCLIIELWSKGKGHSMQTLADEAGITRARVSQIIKGPEDA